MADDSDLLTRIHYQLGSEQRIGFASDPIRVEIEGSTVRLQGEVPSVAAKKLAVRRTEAVADGCNVIDELVVRPAKDMTDDEIRDSVANALLQESALAECRLRQMARDELQTLRDVPGSGPGEIMLEVRDGVVQLSGKLSSHEHKRLTGVLAWWVPGTRDVRNSIVIDPPERDTDAQLTDAIRLALDKDPFVTSEQVKIFSEHGVVRLQGMVGSDTEREMAEADTWFVEGVDDVVNQIRC
ncbi:MAG TPA: BON domain-containing protein [Candidatus Limnocylindrales bacterium]|nr:BON domain-containing protein [Candidatus Limnocylindrales bacterium]